MSSEQPKNIIPSSEYRWALANPVLKRHWIGLTEREFNLLYEWSIKMADSEWYMWVAGWPDWKKVSEVEKTWECYLPEFPADLDQPPKTK